MSSYYPEDDGSTYGPPIPPTPENLYQTAQATVRTPALLLILTGVLTLLASLINLFMIPKVPDICDAQIAEIRRNPNLTQEEKEMWTEFFTELKNSFENPINLPLQILDIFLAVIILVGGIQLRNLSGVGFPVASSILAMIPCISGCCCLLGLPAGIWALVVLFRPEVQTVIAWRRFGGYPPPGM